MICKVEPALRTSRYASVYVDKDEPARRGLLEITILREPFVRDAQVVDQLVRIAETIGGCEFVVKSPLAEQRA